MGGIDVCADRVCDITHPPRFMIIRSMAAPSRRTITMNSEETSNWPNGDMVPRATRGTESCDIRVHKLFLSFSSPVFEDMVAHGVYIYSHFNDFKLSSLTKFSRGPSRAYPSVPDDPVPPDRTIHYSKMRPREEWPDSVFDYWGMDARG